MLRSLVALLPQGVIKFCGSLQFRLPVVGPMIGYFGRRFVAGQGTIKYGIGAGLQFDATNLAPGFVLGTTDPLEQEALAKYLKPGGVFYDIGANAGFFCVLASRVVGEDGKVYAFEPHPEFAARIRKNSALNRFQIEVIEAAVSDSVGNSTLRIDGVACPSIAFGQGGSGLQVELVTVDHLIANRGFRPPDYIVIDAEGAELQVLGGMRETLRISLPVVLVEVHWLGKQFADYFDRNIRPLGYEMRNLDGGAIPTDPVRYHALLTPLSIA